ncbi:MAG: thioesterase superfamily enzyme [Actinomycetia bacterium]|nr:thioesterase superfamily enzyme [Actinomycetes bacterium]
MTDAPPVRADANENALSSHLLAPAASEVEEFDSPTRRRLADATRHLIDAVLTSEGADADTLDAAADMVEALAAQLHGAPLGDRPAGRRDRPEHSHTDYLPRSPVVGLSSPMAPPITYEVRGGRVHGTGTFGAPYEGPPGYVHGGEIALAFDELLGIANIVSGHPGMTGTLTVKYRRPTPLGQELDFEAWTERVEGRRITTRGTIHSHGTLTAEAEGLFIIVNPERAAEYFGARAEPPGPVDPLP